MFFRTSLVICLFFVTAVIWGTPEEKKQRRPLTEAEQPILSPTGRKRAEENVRTLEGNIRDLKKNLETTSKNIGTLDTELRELDILEKEHLGLQKKYADYLSQIEKEMKKNEKTQRELTSKGNQKERAELQRWQWDVEAKTAKAKKLLAGVNKNLIEIRSRRGPLEDLLKVWKDRQGEYQQAVEKAQTKKATWEKILSRKS